MAVLGQNQCAPAPNGTPKNLFVCCLFDLVGQTTQTAARYDGFHGDHLAAMKRHGTRRAMSRVWR